MTATFGPRNAIDETEETELSVKFTDDCAKVSEDSLRSVDRAASRGVCEKTHQRLADSQFARLTRWIAGLFRPAGMPGGRNPRFSA